MSRAFSRPVVRGSQAVRQWQLLVELRRGPRTLEQLAAVLGASQRTVYRDIVGLEAVPFPIVRTEGSAGVVWSVGCMRSWPRNEPTPIASLEAVC